MTNLECRPETTVRDMSESSANYVKRARAKLRLTQAELADKLGLERRSIMRFEQGDDLPIQTRLAIRQLLAVYIRKRKRKKNGAE